MKTVFLLIFIIIAFNQSNLKANDVQLTPIEISEIVFSNSGFDYNKILPFCCDMHELNFRDSTLGQMLPVNTVREYQSLYIDDSSSVVAISLDLNNETQDIYVFFTKLDDWHIGALRTLVKTDIIRAAVAGIEKLDTDSALKALSKYGYDDIDKYIKRNNLLIASDKNIENYFNENIGKFDEIINNIQANHPQLQAEEIDNLNKEEFVVEKLKELLIDRIVIAENSECIGFQIGGIMDNTVGFFYQKDPNKVPRISKDLYIMIKPLKNGWYMYKTT